MFIWKKRAALSLIFLLLMDQVSRGLAGRVVLKTQDQGGPQREISECIELANSLDALRSLGDIPIAKELNGLMSAVWLKLKDCQTEAEVTLDEFPDIIEMNPASANLTLSLLEALEAEGDELAQMLENAEEAGDILSLNVTELRSSLSEMNALHPLHNKTGLVQVLESLDQDEEPFAKEEIKAGILRSLQHQRTVRSAETDAEVLVFEDENFEGESEAFSGEVEALSIVWRNSISSLKVPDGHTVVVFEEEDFSGKQTAFHSDAESLDDFSDNIGSLIVLPVKLDELCYRVFEEVGFRGRSEKFCGDLPELPEAWQGKISSVMVEQDGVSLILYEGTFIGTYRYVPGSSVDLGESWNKRTASIQIRPWTIEDFEGYTQPRTILYSRQNFEGREITVESTVDFVGYEMNDRISSVKCEGQCSLVVFEHRNFGGRSRLYDGSQTSLANFDDQLSSVMVLPQRVCVTVFEDRDFRGASTRLCGDVDNLQDLNWNDKISSLKVECVNAPCSVVLFENSNYGGGYKSFMGEIPWVGVDWNDVASSIQIRPWQLDIEQKIERTEVKESCVNPAEQKAYNVIQWIPILSFFYNLATSIYYGAVGCHEVAKERAIDMAIGLAMDAALLVTGGAIGVAAYGGKAAAQAGIKAGLQAAKKAITASVKSAVKQGLKKISSVASKGIIGNIKSITKNVVANAKGMAQALKSVPKATKDGLKAVKNSGIVRSTKEGAAKVRRAVKNKFDDIVASVQRKVDDADFSVGSRTQTGGIQCRTKRALGRIARFCRNTVKVITSTSRRNRAKKFYDDLLTNGNRNFKYKYTSTSKDVNGNIISRTNMEIDAVRFVVNDVHKPKHIFENLQYYHDFMPTNGKLLKEGVEMSSNNRKALFVQMNIGGEPFEFAMIPAKPDRQIVIRFEKKFRLDQSHSYDGIIDVLGDTNQAEHAKAILKAIDARVGPTNNLNVRREIWGTMTDEQIEAAQELIVLTHVAESALPSQQNWNIWNNARGKRPNDLQGGVAGMDGVSRNFFKKISEGRSSFQQAFNPDSGSFLIARDGGKKQTKQILARPNAMDPANRQFDADLSDLSSVDTSNSPRSIFTFDRQD